MKLTIKKAMGTIFLSLLFVMIIFSNQEGNSFVSEAHSGRTDSNGGHKDNKNKSGLGYYHYHCGGNPPHLHSGGYCPYNSSSSNESSNSSIPKKKVDKITVHSYSSSMIVGENQSINFDVESSSSNSDINVYSSDPNIISVNGNILNAVSVGNATITIETSNNSESFTISIKEIQAEDIQLNIGSNELQWGTETQILYNTIPENVTYINWTSSDDSIATISPSGVLCGLKPGNVTITASSTNGVNESIEMSIYEIKPSEIQSNEDFELIVGDNENIDIKIMPENSNNKMYTVICDNENIIEITGNNIKAIGEGKTNVIIKTWNGIEKIIPVEVKIIPVESINISDSSKYMFSNFLDKNGHVSISANTTPYNATYNQLAWKSSNEKNVSIGKNNEFIINGVGKVTLTCKSQNNISTSITLFIIEDEWIFVPCTLLFIILIFVLLKPVIKKLKEDNNNLSKYKYKE